MIKQKKIALYALMIIMFALISSTAFADHASCVQGCGTTLANQMAIAIAGAALVAAACCLFTAGVGCAACVAASALALTVAMAALASAAQDCINQCPPDPET